MKLLISALTKYLAGLLMVMLLLFLPAGTVSYLGGWLLIGLLFGPMLILGAVLLLRAPALLEKRLKNKETQSAQKGVVGGTALLFLASFLLAGLDFRYGWTTVPLWLVITASVLLLASYAMYAEVLRENVYLSRIVEVQAGQKVIDTGLYGIVRHPMYTATTVLFLTIPLVLGSFAAFAVMVLYLPFLIVRIREEEALLVRELPGYAAYREKVRFRLIPYLW